MQVRCPQCHTPVEMGSDGNLSDIACPSCGSSFSLLGTEETVPYERGTKTIGHFDLIEQVGIGTFGSIWKAARQGTGSGSCHQNPTEGTT